MMINPISRSAPGIALLAAFTVWGVCGGALQAGPTFDLDYTSTTQLPSDQGLTYTPLSPAASETSAYSISNQLLHLDTISVIGDKMAYYQLDNGYDHTEDAVLEMKVKVLQLSGTFGLFVGFNDPTYQTYFTVTPTGWNIYNTSSSGTFADPGAFHVLKLQTFAATHTFEFSVDGVLAASGLQNPGFAGDSIVIFGDGSPTGGNIRADFEYIRYNVPLTTVPEPSTATMALVVAVFWCVRRSRQSTGG